MDLLVVIFSGAALIGVGISLIGFLEKVPKGERLAVIALTCVGGMLLIVLALYAAGTSSSSNIHGELCEGVNRNREAIQALIIAAEQDATNRGEALRHAAESVDGPVC